MCEKWVLMVNWLLKEGELIRSLEKGTVELHYIFLMLLDQSREVFARSEETLITQI